nr:MAG TPA: hypothetical protein [Caudoviricetes sp.]
MSLSFFSLLWNFFIIISTKILRSKYQSNYFL